MKKVLLTLLGIIVVAGVLAGVGLVGYRMGYNHAALTVSNKTVQPLPLNKDFDPRGMPMLRGFGNDFGMRGMPMHNFGNDFGRGFGMPHRGRGFGFFSPIRFLLNIAILALLIWVAYKLIKGSGWTIMRQPAAVAKVEAPEAEPKNE